VRLRDSLDILLYLSTCLSWGIVMMGSCALNWVTKILMRAISNVHAGRIWSAGRRFPIPALMEICAVSIELLLETLEVELVYATVHAKLFILQ